MCLSHCIVMSGLICPSLIVTIFAPLATQFYCFPCVCLLSQDCLQQSETGHDYIAPSILFPLFHAIIIATKTCWAPRKQWRRETCPGTGRVRYDWSFDIRVLRQHNVSFEAVLVVESKYEAL